VDDIIALLLALSASPEEVETLLISVTYGNVPLQRYHGMILRRIEE
jgi:inosine-uridine nucleoside N-ribohydrolase